MSTTRIHWARIALVGYVTLIAGVPDAQLARQTSLPDDNIHSYTIRGRSVPSSDGWLPPNARLAALTSAPPPVEPVVILNGHGGWVHKHQANYFVVARSGAKAKVRGPCWSACALIAAFIPKDRLCFGESAFLAFHSAIADTARCDSNLLARR